MRRPRLLLLLSALALAAVCLYLGVQIAPPRYLFPAATNTNSDGAVLDVLLHQIAAETVYGTQGGTSLQCHDLSSYGLQRVQSSGYSARMAALLTLQEKDYRTDGHTLLEVWHPAFASWVVVDFSTDRLYPQTLVSFIQARMPYIALSSNRVIDLAYTDPDGVFSNPEAFYDRISDVAFLMAEDGIYTYGNSSHREQVQSYSDGYRYDPQFVQHFYS